MRDDAGPQIVRAAGNQAVAAYRSYFDTVSGNRATRRNYACQLRRFFVWAEGRGLTLEEINSDALGMFVAKLSVATSPQNAKMYLTPIRGLFRHLVFEGVLAENPCGSYIPLPKGVAANGAETVDPQTPEEWQAAVDAAELALTLDSLVQYGLLDVDGGGLGVNADRCREILERGLERGITPKLEDGLPVVDDAR